VVRAALRNEVAATISRNPLEIRASGQRDEDRDFSYVDGRTGWRELMAEMYGEALPE
jgi:hypothetical protein